jgi:dTDP-4-amino-4,6-dideoxygalactose transaminase
MTTQPALLGGTPLLSRPCHLVRPVLPTADAMLAGWRELETSGVLSNQGQFARTLETRVADRLDVPYCAVFASGTTALMCLARALDLDGEILVPSFTFAATAQALSWQGLRLRFVDIDPVTLHMTPELAEAAITPATVAVAPVNLFGGCARLDEFEAMAARRGLKLLFDSAQAFGAEYRGRPVGGFGDAEVLSFHATKAFHTGEGGAVVTRSRDLYERLCRTRNYGFANYLDCVEAGVNGKLDELSALVGLRVLDVFPGVVTGRWRAIAAYESALAGIAGISRLAMDPEVAPAPSYFTIRIDERELGLNSLELNYALMAERIVTRCYFYPPVHRTTYYQRLLGADRPHLPETDRAATNTLSLPLHADLSADTIAAIALAIRRCREHAPAIRQVLHGKVPRDWDAHSARRYCDPYDVFIRPRGAVDEAEAVAADVTTPARTPSPVLLRSGTSGRREM